MQSAEPAINQLVNKNSQKIFSCSGYADTRPVNTAKDVESRRQNRRIDIRFSMSAPDATDITVVKFVKERMKKND